ncbi:SDR family oxidoreductase [Marinicella sp. S1101]|uniref:SDR family oxidoreductase n=1 Tax=Marinicella marina TaxID=2996016 RepID=UPI002260A229|nr:SDR family oxidoreductase [Marinicella marina]MCX7553416.1 SDR family oxidoreductase [Marinicella marina]MDJ1140040.1 SDR family oxidoreductase [Marinicella marina]
MKSRKNTVITGASSGLGMEMARQYAKQGKNLGICARRVNNLSALKDELLTINPDIQVEVLALDVNDHEQVFEVFKQFKTAFGQIDRIILNAGMGKGASIGTGFFHANKQTAETNFVALLAQAEATLEIMRAQGHGHLVAISSISGYRGYRRALNVYAATKAAVTNLCEGMYIDLMGTDIKVSCVHPGFIRSEINEKVKKAPFMVDTETGVKAMIKAIEKEKLNSHVPIWPWAFLRYIFPILPRSLIRKMS